MTEVGQVASTYIGMILVIAGLAFVACRVGRLVRARQHADSILTHHSTLTLTPQCSVAVVRTTQEELILGLTAQQVTLLTRAPLTTLAASSGHPQASVDHSLCRQRIRKTASKPRRVFPQCQFFALPKPPR